MQQEIQSAAEDYLLTVEIDDWVAHRVEKHRIEPLAVRRDEMFFEDLGEAQVDVRYDHVQRAIIDYSEPVDVAGRVVELHIPFAGDPRLLRLPRTFTYNPPQAGVKGHEIVKHFSWPGDTARPVSAGRETLGTDDQQVWTSPGCSSTNLGPIRSWMSTIRH
jgi:hypothetical protein